MSQGTLVVTCGLPGSGKTTFTQKLAEQFNGLVVDQDALVTAVHGGNYTRYGEDLKGLYHGLEDYILDAALAKKHHLIIVDRCCPKADTRSRFGAKARALGYRTILVFFDLEHPSDGDKVRRRMQGGARGHSAQKWMQVIQDMKKGFELPNRSEPFDIIAPPGIALTFIKLAVSEDLAGASGSLRRRVQFEAMESVADSSPQAAAQSSEGSPSPAVKGLTEPQIEAMKKQTLCLPQTETSQQPGGVPQAEPGQRPSSPVRKSLVKPAQRKSTGSSSAPQGSSESTAQGE